MAFRNHRVRVLRPPETTAAGEDVQFLIVELDPRSQPPCSTVHPPHEPVHGWRDFLLHILTITIGLLIALTLEAAVEAIHHRHIVAEARENIRREIEDNQKLVASNRRDIEADKQRMQADLQELRVLRKDPNAKVTLTLAWKWSGPSKAAWDTARDTGALSLMNYSTVQGYAETYNQQQLVSDEATALIRNQTTAMIPLMIETDPSKATQPQFDEALHRCSEVIIQLQLLSDLINGLDRDYSQALRSE